VGEEQFLKLNYHLEASTCPIGITPKYYPSDVRTRGTKTEMEGENEQPNYLAEGSVKKTYQT